MGNCCVANERPPIRYQYAQAMPAPVFPAKSKVQSKTSLTSIEHILQEQTYAEKQREALKRALSPVAYNHPGCYSRKHNSSKSTEAEF